MTAPAIQSPVCPKCGGPVWDQKAGKYPWKPGTPIFKCRTKECASNGGVIWEPKGNGKPVEQQHHTEWKSGEVPVATKADELFALYDQCFQHALIKAVEAEKVGIGSDLQGVSAVAATLFIQARK